MRSGVAVRLGVASAVWLAPLLAVSATAGGCNGNPDAIGTSRVIEVDTARGPHIGGLHFENDPLKLRPKEVVLTFDDGPNPYATRKILDVLDRHCARATFFPVGKQVAAAPGVLREVAARGHTIGAHSWSHPPNLRRLSRTEALAEIERGFIEVEAALAGSAGLGPAARRAAADAVAPFFRFPGLNHARDLFGYLHDKSIGTFSVDVVSDDWKAISSRAVLGRTLSRLNRTNGGIVLLHDIKSRTAALLPRLLRQLKRRGYRLVHLVPRRSIAQLVAERRERARQRRAIAVAAETRTSSRTVQR